MDSFGATLRKEREERGLTLDTVAALIGIGRGALAALERDDFDSLPEHQSMLDGLRAYADCLQVDAEMMIEHYEQERERCLRRLADFVAERAAEITPVEIQAAAVQPPPQRQRRRKFRQPLIAPVIVSLLALVGVWWAFRGEPNVAPAATRAQDQAQARNQVQPQTPVESRTATTRTKPAPTRARNAAPTEPTPLAPASGIGVSEFGIGSAVRNQQLVGRTDRFTRGAQAWFWTRVEGGQRGDTIEHVWLHEGVEAARIPLNIGGARWRTQSSKTLRSSGSWAVEARDAGGRVLARTEFSCVR